jgi:hypothetical protein
MGWRVMESTRWPIFFDAQIRVMPKPAAAGILRNRRHKRIGRTFRGGKSPRLEERQNLINGRGADAHPFAGPALRYRDFLRERETVRNALPSPHRPVPVHFSGHRAKAANNFPIRIAATQTESSRLLSAQD